ncbi:MAG: ferrous iron transporter B [Halobacteriota archaeon]|nr:ferrous iron transporter B [Halobacteriota archaeon]
MKILLMGNPNVGKSVIFSRLTGLNVITSNYPGTTVDFKKGTVKFGGEKAEIIDVPGSYTLEPTSKAEEVAVEMLKEGDVIINVVDATNLERNLHLTLELLEQGIPTIVVLNLWDETKHKGIIIDVDKLEEHLGVPVVPTVAVTGEGIKELTSTNPKKPLHPKRTEDEQWAEVGKIIREVQTVTHHHHTLLERMGDASIKPLSGAIIALIIMVTAFEFIRFIGEGLINYLFDPIFVILYKPIIEGLGEILGGGFLFDIIIGTLIDGEIDFVQSMGLLSTGLYVPFAMVLPYVFAFYLGLGLLEDSGYLPRLAVLVDTIMHRIGLHGLSIVPMFLGLGCNVPGALSTRVLETKKQRFIAATLMAVAIPCIAQIAMIAGLVGEYGMMGFGVVFLTLFLVWLVLGMLLSRIMKGESPEIFLEIPPYRIPSPVTTFKKLWMRIRSFLTEAVPFMLLGVVIINALYSFGIIQFIGELTEPLIVGLLGLPAEAVGALVVGFLRKDVAIGMLIPLELTMNQAIVASVVLAMYFPCVATFVVLVRELGVVDMLKSATIMISTAFLVGGLLNVLLGAIP